MNNAISAHAIENQIASDIRACEQLLQLLDEENTALTTKDTEALARIIEAKTAPLQHLENSARQRTEWANIQAQDNAGEKWQALLDSLDGTKLKQDWEQLKLLTLRCREKNEVNGKVLIRNQQVFSRLLNLLRGQTQSPDLYTKRGGKTSTHSSVRVDEA